MRQSFPFGKIAQPLFDKKCNFKNIENVLDCFHFPETTISKRENVLYFGVDNHQKCGLFAFSRNGHFKKCDRFIFWRMSEDSAFI